MIEKIRFVKFTAFKELEIPFARGINILVGENGTGKTHILKALYAACEITRSQGSLAEKANKVFLPSGEQIGRLVKRAKVSTKGFFEVSRRLSLSQSLRTRSLNIKLTLSSHTKTPDKAKITGHLSSWMENKLESVYIPVKDMLENAPGFRSLYNLRNIHFEEVYSDIIDRAFLGSLKGPADIKRKRLLEILQQSMEGKVSAKNEEFFLKNKDGELEFTLLAEGIRKLALLWILIQNGTLTKGSVLCWDEPETNLNPKLMKTVVEILVELQRMGVQIFLTTHDYVILKEFDLQTNKDDDISFHSLYRKDGEIHVSSTKKYLDIHPNAIDDTFGDLINREIGRSMGKVRK